MVVGNPLARVLKVMKGVAAGPSGMTSDHIRLLLDNRRDSYLLFLLGASSHGAGGSSPSRQIKKLSKNALGVFEALWPATWSEGLSQGRWHNSLGIR